MSVAEKLYIDVAVCQSSVGVDWERSKRGQTSVVGVYWNKLKLTENQYTMISSTLKKTQKLKTYLNNKLLLLVTIDSISQPFS